MFVYVLDKDPLNCVTGAVSAFAYVEPEAMLW